MESIAISKANGRIKLWARRLHIWTQSTHTLGFQRNSLHIFSCCDEFSYDRAYFQLQLLLFEFGGAKLKLAGREEREDKIKAGNRR
jgi:hypothetical protein